MTALLEEEDGADGEDEGGQQWQQPTRSAENLEVAARNIRAARDSFLRQQCQGYAIRWCGIFGGLAILANFNPE